MRGQRAAMDFNRLLRECRKQAYDSTKQILTGIAQACKGPAGGTFRLPV